jgi:hypothetical protein
MLIILIILFLIGVFILLNREPRSEWEKYLEKELERNPDYINWLKYANGGREYKRALRILTRIDRDRNKVFYKLLKKIRG